MINCLCLWCKNEGESATPSRRDLIQSWLDSRTFCLESLNAYYLIKRELARKLG